MGQKHYIGESSQRCAAGDEEVSKLSGALLETALLSVAQLSHTVPEPTEQTKETVRPSVHSPPGLGIL